MAENQDINSNQRLNNLLSARLKLLDELKNANKAYVDLLSEAKTTDEDHNKKLKEQADLVAKVKKQFTGVNTAIKDINQETSTLVDGFATAGNEINSLTSLQEEFKKSLTKSALKGVALSREIRSIGGESKESYRQALTDVSNLIGTVASLANLNKEDSLEIAAKNDEFATKYDELIGLSKSLTEASKAGTIEDQTRAAVLASMVESLDEAHKKASEFNNVDKEHSEFLKELTEDYESVNKTLKKVTYSIETMLSSGRGFTGMLLIGAGTLIEKFHEVGREMGYGLTQYQGFTASIMLANLLSKESGDAIREMGKELGDVRELTTGMKLDVATFAYHMNLSGEEAATLMHAFGDLQGLSFNTGKNTLAYAEHLAIANGLMPNEMMKDIATNTEFFAKFSKDGGRNIAEAALAAGKLGVGLKTADAMADHLLDYQSSVEDEMEASVLLGKDLNLQKARELMYNGKIAEGMQSALEAAGGIDKFNEMDYYQKQAVAKALGTSVSELQKMAAHQQALNGQLGVGEQITASTSDWWQTITGSIAGKGVSALGGFLMTMGQVNFGLQAFGTSFGKIFAGMGNLIGAAIKKFIVLIGLQKSLDASAAASGSIAAASNLIPFTPPVAMGKKARFMKNVGGAAQTGLGSAPQVEKLTTEKPKTTPRSALDKVGSPAQMYAAAVGMIALAASIWILSKAFENFDKLEHPIQTLTVFAGAIVGMALGLWGASKLMTAGAAEIGIAALLMLGFGASILMIGEGFKLFGDGIATIGGALPAFTANIGGLIAMVTGVIGLAAAFGILSASLVMLGTAGLTAMPVLLTLAGIGVGLAAMSSFMKGGGATDSNASNTKAADDPLLKEIIGLRSDMESGKIGVFIDGVKAGVMMTRASNNNKSLH